MLSKLPVFQAVNTWCPNFRTLTVRFTNWIFTHYASEEVRLKVWMGIGTVLFCHTKENADYGWHPFSRPLNQIYEDMVEKEVKKRVEKELRIRALKKAQDEIGKK